MEIRHKGNDENALEVLLADANKTGEGVDTFRGSTTERILKAAADVGEVLTFKGADFNLLEELARKLGGGGVPVCHLSPELSGDFGAPWPVQQNSPVKVGFAGMPQKAGYETAILLDILPEKFAFELEYTLIKKAPLIEVIPADLIHGESTKHWLNLVSLVIADLSVMQVGQISFCQLESQDANNTALMILESDLTTFHNVPLNTPDVFRVGFYFDGAALFLKMGTLAPINFGAFDAFTGALALVFSHTATFQTGADLWDGTYMQLVTNQADFVYSYPSGSRDLCGNLLGGAA